VTSAVEPFVQTLFWNAIDLERKLSDFQSYYNRHRTHSPLGGDMPAEVAWDASKLPIKLDKFHWQNYCKTHLLQLATDISEKSE
jgi:hypothetical protein